jgi:formamidopyrimidine-DNA glycosylase
LRLRESALPLKALNKGHSLDEIIEKLTRQANQAYCDYMARMGSMSCLGQAIKLQKGEFGESELSAHKAAERQLGRHQGFQEAIRMIREARHICTECGGRGASTMVAGKQVYYCNCPDEPAGVSEEALSA